MDNESTYNKPTMLVMQLVLQLSTKQCESCVVFTRNFVSNYNKTKYIFNKSKYFAIDDKMKLESFNDVNDDSD